MSVQIQILPNNDYSLGGYLTVDERYAVPVNFSVSDIKDLSKRKGAYTKTVKVKGDKTANQLLGQLFDVNIATGDFDRKKRTPAILLEDGVPAITGYLRLMQVTKLSQSNNTWDQQVEYDVVIYDDTSNFYQAMGDSELSDLDFSDLDHNYSSANVLASVSNDWTDGYKYVWPMSTDNTYDLKEFKPAIYARQYWDRIFARAGYTYTWASRDSDGIQFSKLMIPYNGGSPTVTPEDIAENTVSASGSSLGFTYSNTPGQMSSFQSQMILPTEITDPSGAYDNTTGEYTNPFYLSQTNQTQFRFTLTYRINLLNNESGTSYLRRQDESFFGVPAGFVFRPWFRFAVNGTLQPTWVSVSLAPVQVTSNNVSMYSLPAGSTSIANVTTVATFNFPNSGNIQPGDVIEVFCGASVAQFTTLNTAEWSTSNVGVWNANPASVDLEVFLSSARMDVIPQMTAIGFNSTIRMNRYVPKKVKQRDFVKGIMTMFNLYTEIDPDDPNNLIIYTRDEYYDSGAEKNWTSKLCADMPATIQFTPELVSRRLRLTYKQGSDPLNVGYLDNTGDVYGEVRYTFDDENVKGEDSVETIFEPAPVLTAPFGAVVLGVEGAAPNTGVKIVYDGGARGAQTYTIYDETNVVGYSGSTYNYCGHFDHPLTPNFDLNFGVCDYYYYNDWQYVTNQNLFNLHWRRTLGQINDGKMLSAYFNLGVADITKLKMNDKIFIKDSWWNIQEVVDYNASKRQPTLVRLISVDSDINFAPFRSKPTLKPGLSERPVSRPVTSLVEGVSLGRNTSDSTYVNRVMGTGNYFGGDAQNNLIIGDRNLVNGERSLVLGDGNAVTGSGNLVIGDDLTVTADDSLVVDGVVIPISGLGTWERSGDDIKAVTVIASPTVYPNVLPSDSSVSDIGSSALRWNDVWAETLNFDRVEIYAEVTVDGSQILIGNNTTSVAGFSSIAIGDSTVANDGSVAVGIASQATGVNSIAYGIGSLAIGDYSVSVGNGQATGDYSVAIGSNGSGAASGIESLSLMNGSATGNYSIAIGPVTANKFGEFARGVTTFNNYGFNSCAIQTANATPAEVFLDGSYFVAGSARFTIETNSVYQINVFAVAVRTDTDEVKEWQGRYLIKNVGGTTSLVGGAGTLNSSFADASMATATLAFSADNTNDSFKCDVTGIAATNIRWHVQYQYSKIIF